MIEVLSEDEWIEIIVGSKSDSLMLRPDFLNSIASAFNCDVKYFMCINKGAPIVGSSVFVRGGKIIVPSYYMYTGLWMAESEQSLLYRECLALLIDYLKRCYSSIDYRLSPELKDVRPFIWKGFTAKLRYTYLRNLKTTIYRANVRSRIKKAESNAIKLEVSNDFENIWRQQEKEMKGFGMPNKLREANYKMFKGWFNSGYITAIVAKKEDIIIGSALLLINSFKGVGYNMLISSNKGYYNTGVHSALYDKIFKYYQERNLFQCDLVGANIKSIAEFKYNFEPDLAPYYELSYHQESEFLTRFKSMVKNMVRH